MHRPLAILLGFVVVAVAGAVLYAASAPADEAPPADGPAPKPSRDRAAQWTDTAVSYRGDDDAEVTFRCPPAGTAGSVWGTDVYTDDSSVCTAAVHMGLLTFQTGGTVRIQIGPGKEAFAGSTRHGVTSSDYGPWGGSFSFVRAPAE